MEVSEAINYDSDYQRYILTQVFNSHDIYSRCKNILRPEYFSAEFQKGVQFVNEFSGKYSTLPDPDMVKLKAQFDYAKTDVSPLMVDSILTEVGQFCKHRAIENAIVEGSKFLAKKQYGVIEKLVKEAMLVSLQTELGLDIYENPLETISNLADMQGTMKSGWETLDFKLFGGFGRQELEIFAAKSGGGKSVVLQNLAANFSNLGINGVYITLELAEELVAVRIYSMMVDDPITNVRRDPITTAEKIDMFATTNGALQIKRLPESVTTVNDIEAYLREYQIKTGKKLDYVCVDYLDLLTSDACVNRADTFTKDKFVSEELRAMAMKLDITVFTAAQFNRSGINEEEKSQSQISGGISKIFTADNVIFLEANRNNGTMVFDFQKTRNSSAVGTKLLMHYNINSLRIKDLDRTVDELEAHAGFKPSPNIDIGKSLFNNVVTNSTFATLSNKLSNNQTNSSEVSSTEQKNNNTEQSAINTNNSGTSISNNSTPELNKVQLWMKSRNK